MKSDFDLIRWDFNTKEDITIIPVSDVHFGSAECMEKEFRNFLKYVEESPNIYLTLGGDLIDNGVRNSVCNPFEQKYRPSQQKRMMAEMLYPVRDRILCAVGGNHEARSMKETDTDITLDILSKLDKEVLYRPNVAFMLIRMNPDQKVSSKYRPTYTFAVTHGAGGGMTGANVNRNERFGNIIEGIDCLIVGHSHKPAVTSPSKIRLDANAGKVKIVPYKQIISTSWLNYGGYALKAQLTPASHSLQKVHLCSNHKELIVTM